MDELSMLAMATGIIPKDATCRTCRYRTKFYYDNPIKVKHCCQKQLSDRSYSGLKTIKVNDKACFRYEKEERK